MAEGANSSELQAKKEELLQEVFNFLAIAVTVQKLALTHQLLVSILVIQTITLLTTATHLPVTVEMTRVTKFKYKLKEIRMKNSYSFLILSSKLILPKHPWDPRELGQEALLHMQLILRLSETPFERRFDRYIRPSKRQRLQSNPYYQPFRPKSFRPSIS